MTGRAVAALVLMLQVETHASSAWVPRMLPGAVRHNVQRGRLSSGKWPKTDCLVMSRYVSHTHGQACTSSTKNPRSRLSPQATFRAHAPSPQSPVPSAPV